MTRFKVGITGTDGFLKAQGVVEYTNTGLVLIKKNKKDDVIGFGYLKLGIRIKS